MINVIGFNLFILLYLTGHNCIIRDEEARAHAGSSRGARPLPAAPDVGPIIADGEDVAAGAVLATVRGADNMPLDVLAEAVRRARGRALTEASGGIRPATAAAIAATGVDLLSVGWLTHSAPALDVALDVLPGGVLP